MQNQFKPILSVCIIINLIILGSCGRVYDEKASSDKAINFNSTQSIDANEPLDSTSTTIARRICYSLRTKRTNFLTEKIGSHFSFSLNTTNCNSQVSTRNVASVLSRRVSDNSMFFESDSAGDFTGDLQTDEHGVLKDFCRELLQGRSGFKIMLKETNAFEYYLFTKGDDDQVTIRSGTLSQDGSSFTPDKITTMTIATSSKYGDLQGLEVKTSTAYQCSNKNTQTIDQAYLGF